MSSTITIIIGLPGSGKTTFIKNNFKKLENILICDDFHKSSSNHTHNFTDSRYYLKLKDALSMNKNIVLSDIAWCKKERRDLLLSEIDKLTKKLKINPNIEFIYFENNPLACKNNVIKRDRKERVERELQIIDEWSAKYIIPDNIKTFPVYN
ncbi:MAG: AAA family ATPase [Patescibacteria group bacterium]